MITPTKSSVRSALAATLFALSPAFAQPLTTAFTYQGELKNGASLVTGNHDLRFHLYDTATGGTEVGTAVCADNVSVLAGRFSVALDFGVSAFAGSRRFLQIEVRQDTGLTCATTTGFTTLSQRQELTAAPYASYALSTASAVSATNSLQLNGQPASFYTNAGNLTSGTLSPSIFPNSLTLSGGVTNGFTFRAVSTATSGESFAARFEANSFDGAALLGTNTGIFGIRGITTHPSGTAISGEATSETGDNLGIMGYSASPDGVGAVGYGGRIGVHGYATSPGGAAIRGLATGADGFGGYFVGKGYFSDKVGVGTTSPAAGLHVVRNWDNEDGALRLEGDRATLRFTSGAAGGNQSWLLHVGSDGPGNLSFYNRCGAWCWANVVSITPGGLGIGVANTNSRPLYTRTGIIYPARFESTHPLATGLEISNTASSAVWEFGVAGTGAPFGLSGGSMYLFRQGASVPGLSISGTSVTTPSLYSTYISASNSDMSTAAVYGSSAYVGVQGSGVGTGSWGEKSTSRWEAIALRPLRRALPALPAGGRNIGPRIRTMTVSGDEGFSPATRRRRASARASTNHPNKALGPGLPAVHWRKSFRGKPMNRALNRTAIASAAIVTLSAALLFGGPLNPPAGPITSTYKTLAEVEPRTALSVANTPGDAANLYIISQPGSYYLTGETIGASGKNGIRISTSHVTVDLNGYRLVGSSGSLNGIVLPVSGQQNITIKNGFISSWGQLGIDLNLTRNCIVKDVQVVGTGSNGVHLGDSGVVTGCIANANGGHGFVAGSASVFSSCSARQNGGDGFNVSSGSSVSGCAALLNIGRGFFASFSATVTECSAYDNDGDGISVASGSTVSRCSARGNGEDGIDASTACCIRDNNLTANGQEAAGGAGIRAIGSDSRIEGNACSAQTRGIEVLTAGNIILRNTCSGNTTNWSIVAGNAVAPIVQPSNNAAAISGNTYAGSLGSTDPNANFTY